MRTVTRKLFIVISIMLMAKEYPFVLLDSPPVIATMRQTDVTYLSAYRLSTGFIYDNLDERWALSLDVLLTSVLYMPLTHEEGHRSILTANDIGSISKPYFNRYGAAYVIGVTDSTLKNLRDSDLPTYIRLHTAGLESDYAIMGFSRQALIFDGDKRIAMEYLVRRFSHLTYLGLSVFPSLLPELEEEEDELKRDIVGHDVWGMARHLHRSDMDFYRYTEYDDFTSDEEDFIKRVALLSLVNLADPAIYYIFKRHDVPDMLFTGGYTITPFGDMAEVEFLWDKGPGISTKLRAFGNKSRAFPGLSVGIGRYEVTDRLSLWGNVELWQQPEELDFWTKQAEIGAGGMVFLGYRPTEKSPLWLEAGLIAKTSGFMLENMYLQKNIGFSLQIRYVKE